MKARPRASPRLPISNPDLSHQGISLLLYLLRNDGFVEHYRSCIQCSISVPNRECQDFGEQKAPTHQNFGKGRVKPSAIVAVAPTWARPLPIVFGRGSEMESRYGFLRGTLRAPTVGWMMYNMLVSNKKAIQSQYKSHVCKS